jgi:rfaE bifunctional protein kinase chain/domain
MSSIDNIFEQFNNLKIAVIGDVMIDSYLWGKVHRISPEAPVPIVNVVKREKRLGGAANVALNLMSLGVKPILISVIGNDPEGDNFLQLMAENDFDPDGLVRSERRKTTIKHRIIGGSQQLLRVDAEDTFSLDDSELLKITSRCEDILKSCDAVIFEDYDKGVIDARLINKVVEICKANNIPVAVDPKKNNFLNYHGVDLFKPNLKEMREGLNLDVAPDNIQSIKESSRQLRAQLSHHITLITLSEYGVFYDNEKAGIIPAHKREIADVSGAGDTVISIATSCLALKLPTALIAEMSNLGGGMVCEYVGVVPIEKKALLAETKRCIDLGQYGLDG